MRTLEAIHIASALLLGEGTAVVTYDDRLAAAAGANDLEVASPS